MIEPSKLVNRAAVLTAKVRLAAQRRAGEAVARGWEWASLSASIGPHSKRAASFASFGAGSAICFPPAALFGEHAISIGVDTLIGPYCSLSAGMAPGQALLTDQIVRIGDRCLIGRHSSIVGHFSITIEDDVFLGPNVYITDQNHAYDDLELPIGRQSSPERPVRIGAGSWLGTNSVILPGVTIGKHVVIGAGSVVTRDIPDHSVAAGAPAVVIGDQRQAALVRSTVVEAATSLFGGRTG